MHFKKVLFLALLSNLSSNLFSAEGGSGTGGNDLSYLVSAAAFVSAAPASVPVPAAQEVVVEAAPLVQEVVVEIAAPAEAEVVTARDPRFPHSDFSIKYFPEYGERRYHENILHHFCTKFRSLICRWESNWDQAVYSGNAERQKSIIRD